MTVRVLFVCLGNICRSPTAHGVFRKYLAEANLQESIDVDSCGTGDWHIGAPPDKRTIACAAKSSYDLSDLRARQLEANDFVRYDYILAMDSQNLRTILSQAPAKTTAEIALLLTFASTQATLGKSEVPDPYFGGEAEFAQVLSLIELACERLLQHIIDHDLSK